MALIDEQDAIPVVIDRWEINAVGLEEEILCEMCENPMHTDRGCDGLCSYDKDLYKRIIKVLNDRMKPLQPDVPDTNVGDMISRDAAMEMLMNQNVIIDGSEYHNGFNAGVNRAQEVIRNLPPVQPKRGKWIERESDTEDKENGFETVIVCSCCDFPATTFYSEDCESRTQIRTDFCPNCGADMRGNEDGTD